MPCDGANGLLPGRGAPGRRLAWPGPPEPAPGAPGRVPGRAGVAPPGVPPGRGAEVEGRWSCRAAGAGAAGRGAPGRGAPGVALRATGAAGAAGVAGLAEAAGLAGVAATGALAGVAGVVGATGAGVGAPLRVEGEPGAATAGCGPGAGPSPGVRVDGAAVGRGAVVCAAPEGVDGADGAVGRGALVVVLAEVPADGAPLRAAGADLGVGAAAGSSFSLRRRMTGASRVEEGDLTNSPMSFAIERTVLLSTPSSLASS